MCLFLVHSPLFGYAEVHMTGSYVTVALWLSIKVSVLLKQQFHQFKICDAFLRLPLVNEWFKI
jgi:hypothetical protein